MTNIFVLYGKQAGVLGVFSSEEIAKQCVQDEIAPDVEWVQVPSPGEGVLVASSKTKISALFIERWVLDA